MATAVEPVADADAGLAPSPKKSSKLPLIIGGIGFIVTIQAVLTFLLMPKSEPAQPAAAAKAAVASAEPPASEDEPDQAEVSIGDFSNTNSTATPGVTIHFDFKLVAITTGKQQSQLTDLLKKNNARMRQVVGKIVRGASLDDLTDPTVATIRRLVREEINRLIRKSLIEEVVATDIRFVEQ
jgi:flagellar basal body-associated protein FliL